MRNAFVEIRLLIVMLVTAMLTIPAIVYAIDANGDNLDDDWEATYGISTNAFDMDHLAAWWQMDGPDKVTDRTTNHVDGTLIQAWASQKSFRAKDGSDDDSDGTNFHGQKRSNETHESTTDPDARLYKKS